MRYFQKYILSFIPILQPKFSYSIITYFISSNKDYDSGCNPHLMYQTCTKQMRILLRNEDKSENIKNIIIIFWIQLMDFNTVKLQESYCNLFWKSRKNFVVGTIGNKGEVNVISLNFRKGQFFSRTH